MRTLAAVVLVLLVAPLAAAGTFHVSPSGSDTSPGTQTRPFRTIQRGVDAARPGDTVLVEAGAYAADAFPMVDLDHGGRKGKPLVIAAAPGATPVLLGAPAFRYGIRLRPGVSYVQIAGLVLRGFAGDAIQLDCSACGDAAEHRRVTLRSLEVSQSGTAFRPMSGSGIAVRDSWFHDNEGVGIDCAPGPCNGLLVARTRLERHTGFDWSDGLAVERGRGITVVDSVARENAGDGFDSKAFDTTVSRSQALGNARDGIKLWRGDSAIRDSIAAGNGLVGIVLESGGEFTLAGSLVAENGSVERSYGAYVAYGDAEPTVFRLFDTIFFANNGTALYVGAAATLAREDHDLFWTGAEENSAIDYRGETYVEEADLNGGAWAALSGLGAGTFAARPAFVAGSWRLAAGSPGVDAGTGSGASALALDGTPRPQGAGYDIGPFER